MRVIKGERDMVHHGESKSGIVMHDFLCHLDETFNASSHDLFLDFFKKNKGISKWMIFSDYALNDRNKPNDAITFSIFPYTSKFTELSKLIDKISFKDIKSLKKVNLEFLRFINESEILNISIIMDKNMKLDPFNERELLKTCYRTALNQISFWISNEGEKENYIRLQKAYKTLLREVSKPGANLRNIRNIEIVSNLIAYIAFQVCKSVNVDIIGWFSDRDSILNHKKAKFPLPAIFDLANNLFHNLMLSENSGYTERFVFGVPEETGKMWYDSFNRVPDLISATLADYDYKNNFSSHDKFVPVIESVLTNRNKCLIYKIYAFSDGFQAGYLSLSRGSGDCQ
ncbi:hypothetical protein SKZ59_17535 [Janthinobacterium sp. GMG2]|uniref:hypothetical protein n=1 Tax=Janthinobacterium sp. GMG2 TaxID=3096606 RepID=UPI0029F52BBE|nr:hypothetical protein [Janthinobacterium sp. GMG2]MDX8123587.1 hypothetical protein [Janthinobacterium sp. GMG2]